MSKPTDDLVRKLEKQRATFLELFFDVAFVFALRSLSILLLNELTWTGAFQTLVLLLAVGAIWSLTARVTDQLKPERPAVQLMIISTMLGSVVLAAATGEAFGRTGLIFAVVYLAIQIGRNLFLLFLLRGHQLRELPRRALIWQIAVGVLWVAGAIASNTPRAAMWATAAFVTYLARGLRYPVPKMRRLTAGEMPVGGEYLAERHRQLFIIGLGEVIIAIGQAFRRSGFAFGHTAALVVLFTLTALFWRLYIFRAGEQLAPAIERSANPDRFGLLASYVHLVMIGGLVVTSVGAEFVLDHPFSQPKASSTVTILGGPVLFLAGRTVLEYAVFRRLSRSRLLGLLALAFLTPPMLFVPPLPIAIVATAILAGVVIHDTTEERKNHQPELSVAPGSRP
jgi:low temperature requirement protein LtrA